MKPEIRSCHLKIHAVVFLLYQVVAATTAITAFSFSLTNETDYQALLAFKGQITSDPSGVLSSWNDSGHFCAWTGVSCGKNHQRVTALQLPSLRLEGPLSPRIGNLSFLRVLNLDDNHFSGFLPQEIGRLSRLNILALGNSSFQGELPRNLTNCANLRVLYLVGNNLGGQIPDELGSLTKLRYLGLSFNRFTGEIPLVLGNMSALTTLYLNGNQLHGSVPAELGYLSNLEYLVLGVNNLSGQIPNSLYNISSILAFEVLRNNLEGSLPSDLFLTLPKLEGLYFSGNAFSGPIPSTMMNASQAVRIDLGDNSLIGPVPVDLGELKDLQLLNFAGNYLGTDEGDDFRFLASLANCTKLQVLSFGQNRLQGTLGDSVANLSAALTTLVMYENLISGTIPLGVGNLVNLQRLWLDANMLTGNIPTSIGKLTKLQSLSLSKNNLSGEIPPTLGNMTLLYQLIFENNVLEGAIPASLGNCTSLNLLGLNDNLLVGVVPQEVFGLPSISAGLFLSGNHLTGPIPSVVDKGMNLQVLDVSRNNMSGEIPSTLGNLPVLEYLDLDGNQFSGTIPTSLSKLRGLKLLNLSRNNFWGQIPGFLADLPFIENLDLSFNKFEGEVPNRGIFTNLSAVSVVGNKDLCGGPPSLQLPVCKGGATKKDRKRTSRRTVLVITVTISIFFLLVGIIAITLYCLKRSKTGSASDSTTSDHHPKLSYGELSQATNGFSPTNMIGEGSFGVVYQGVLSSNGQIVAVKVIKLDEQGAGKSFMAECEALRNIRHRNLVKIITSCSGIDFRGEDFKALVFEFMSNGSLDKWLHPVPDEIGGADSNTTLSVAQRFNIAIDVAAALDYLHHQCQIPIVHSDLKPSNVLLDSDFLGHVSDFGLSKFLMVKASGTQSSSIGVRGTIGYLAPEYGVGGEVSTRGDVYSFGILLLELFTGKRPTDRLFSDELGLHVFVERALPDGLNQVIDPLLCLGRVQGNLQQSLLSVLRVGLLCSAAQPNERMDIGKAAAELRKARDVLQVRRRRNRL